MKFKVTTKPNYPEIEILGTTIAGFEGSIDWKNHDNLMEHLTEETVPAEGLVQVDDNGRFGKTPIVHVGDPMDITVFVELVGGMKSLASFTFFGARTAPNTENPDVTNVYVTDGGKADRACDCASRMLAAHPECDGQYKFVDANGSRVFLRVYREFNK